MHKGYPNAHPFSGFPSKIFIKIYPFTCSHWEEQNYRVFLKNFLFYKRSLHSFGQRGAKCTPIFEIFQDKFFIYRKYPLTYLELQSQMTPYLTEKMRKYFSVAGALFCLLQKTPSLISTESRQTHTLNLKKFFILSLIWNWDAKTQPVFQEKQKNFFEKTVYLKNIPSLVPAWKGCLGTVILKKGKKICPPGMAGRNIAERCR